jgi:hypothetical protein
MTGKREKPEDRLRSALSECEKILRARARLCRAHLSHRLHRSRRERSYACGGGQPKEAWPRPMRSGDPLCDGG